MSHKFQNLIVAAAASFFCAGVMARPVPMYLQQVAGNLVAIPANVAAQVQKQVVPMPLACESASGKLNFTVDKKGNISVAGEVQAKCGAVVNPRNITPALVCHVGNPDGISYLYVTLDTQTKKYTVEASGYDAEGQPIDKHWACK